MVKMLNFDAVNFLHITLKCVMSKMPIFRLLIILHNLHIWEQNTNEYELAT